ncbi:putative ubiquitin carboxyl-terminal hydrolase 11 [Selaginella moellendorffii]|uniref:putative ubiquitin carboxyl-terminal hydrolase 11 n=1 Tax=Selaginella moellendorffii TaxID=88036 RepID=UPI000D1CAEAC|nr:putative ubiquitin carboxyl-terminal hydrolase 11 [Selaginella moellendorffii]|eukprot:XP_024528814.1 putative ubiquitin carboxyl-terminal hydrolase 11 [Selaginella moellendorffii]
MAIGLQNQGSTCSMNSSLQCLLHTPRLSDFFAKSDKIRGEVANDFRKLIIESMRSNASVSIKPGPKLQSSPGSQQDAQEYLMFLLNALDQELKHGHDMRAATKMKPVKSGRKDRKGGGQVQSSLVAEIFEGQTRTKLQCPKCSNEASVTLETFMSLSLPVPSSTVGNTITLESCIQEYTKDDMLDAWCCSKCKSKQHNICKKMEFVKLPACLIIHLARFKCDSSGNVEKIDTAIDIPESVEISGQHYSLYGLINHTGDADYGHYTASIKLGNSEWYACDDESVEHVSEHSSSTDAYILFYQKTS